MLDNVMSFVAPHHCCGCDKVGSLLCHNCINYINDESKMVCVACHRPTIGMWLCSSCKMPYQKAWVVGERDGVLQRLIGLYKFQRTKEGYRVLGVLFLNILPELPPNMIIVPVPTVSAHIRERGYDHMLLIAKYVAKKRNLKLERLLFRRTDTKQRQANAIQRTKQAKQAFAVRGVKLCQMCPIYC